AIQGDSRAPSLAELQPRTRAPAPRLSGISRLALLNPQRLAAQIVGLSHKVEQFALGPLPGIAARGSVSLEDRFESDHAQRERHDIRRLQIRNQTAKRLRRPQENSSEQLLVTLLAILVQQRSVAAHELHETLEREVRRHWCKVVEIVQCIGEFGKSDGGRISVAL